MQNLYGKDSLAIVVAKHIRSAYKKLGVGQCSITIELNIDFGNELQTIKVDGKTYNTKLIGCLQDFGDIVSQGLGESCRNGVLSRHGTTCKVTVFGKPVKSFMMLQRLVERRTRLHLEWCDIKTTGFGRHEESDNTKYLCYDDERRKEAIEFIRKNRKSRASLFAGVANEVGKDFERTVLNLIYREKDKDDVVLKVCTI
jgi:hypothetical protein